MRNQQQQQQQQFDVLVERFVEYLRDIFYSYDPPKCYAKGILFYLDNAPHWDWGWSLSSIMNIFFEGIEEWDVLGREEKERLSWAIYRRIEEIARKEKKWAGYSLEEWFDLFKEGLVKRGDVRDTDEWFLDLYENYLKYFTLEGVIETAFEGNRAWEYMPRDERKELLEKLKKLIKKRFKEFKKGKKAMKTV